MEPDTIRTIFELIAMVLGAGAAIWRLGRWLGMTMAKLTYLTETVETGFEEVKAEMRELRTLETALNDHRERLTRLEQARQTKGDF